MTMMLNKFQFVVLSISQCVKNHQKSHSSDFDVTEFGVCQIKNKTWPCNLLNRVCYLFMYLLKRYQSCISVIRRRTSSETNSTLIIQLGDTCPSVMTHLLPDEFNSFYQAIAYR